MNKKKILTIALVVALIAIMVSGTLAYFTDTDEVTNTFTIGSVLIDIWENNEITDEPVIEIDEKLIPVVNAENPAQDESYIDKIIQVESNGENPAYIRTHIAVPKALDGYLRLDVSLEGWTQHEFSTLATVDGVEYIVYTYDHTEAVSKDSFTKVLLKGVYLDSAADIKDNPATPSADLEFCKPGNDGYTFSGFVAHNKVTDGYTSNTVCVLVASQAIQAQGFGNATEALNTGFGANTNPWQ